MGAPYSLDLRKRVVAAIKGGMSRNQAAKQFGVAISTAIGWMRRVEETGSVEPSQIGGYKPKAISGEHAVWLAQRIKGDDFTLRGLVTEVQTRVGQRAEFDTCLEHRNEDGLPVLECGLAINDLDEKVAVVSENNCELILSFFNLQDFLASNPVILCQCDSRLV